MPRDMPDDQLIHLGVIGRLTCSTLRALLISPLESFNSASRPSSVKLTLLISCSRDMESGTHPSFSTTSSTFLATSFSGKGENLNLVHLDWIAGVILLT